jgi:hypothetical protein
MDKSRDEKLLTVIDSSSVLWDKWSEALKTANKTDKDSIIKTGAGVFWNKHERLALKSIFIDKDLRAAKQNLYTCGRLDEFVIRRYDANIFEYGINHFSYAMLSDSPELIHAYSNLTYLGYEKMIQRGTATPLYILQCLVKEDWTEFERAMVYMKKKTVPRFKMELDMIFYEALANKDTGRVQSVLSELVSPKVHKVRNKFLELVNEFVSHPAIGYAKLAWMKGIQIEIDSRFIPKELLPIEPLNQYQTEYQFLKQL